MGVGGQDGPEALSWNMPSLHTIEKLLCNSDADYKVRSRMLARACILGPDNSEEQALETIQWLLNMGASVKQWALRSAILHGSLAIVKTLVAHDPELILQPPTTGQISPLCYAAAAGDIETFRFLKSKGAVMGTGDARYELGMAACNGRLDMVRYLVTEHEPPFNLNEQDTEGRTPLVRNLKKMTPEVVELLLALGARTDLVDSNGKSTLDYAMDTEGEGAKALVAYLRRKELGEQATRTTGSAPGLRM